MLVLTRKVGEAISIGDDIKVIVMKVSGKQVKLGIKASPSTVVHREEVYQKIHEENIQASQARVQDIDKIGKLIDSKAPTASPQVRESRRTLIHKSDPLDHDDDGDDEGEEES